MNFFNQPGRFFRAKARVQTSFVVAALCILPTRIMAQGCPQVVASNDTTVCSGDVNVQLSASDGFASYSWSPAAGLDNPSAQNPTTLVSTTTDFIVTATSTTGNLLTNGDFSAGNTGFTSGLIYTPFYSPGNYFVGPDFFNLALSYDVDHSSTADNYFMSIDGAMSLNTLWESNVSVSPGQDYQFSFWCIRTDAVQPVFEIHFIGDVTGDDIVATITGLPYAGVWEWDQYGPPLWNSGANTSLTIRIINLETDGYGNDFALDDMTLAGPCYSTDTVTVQVASIPPPPAVSDTLICSQVTLFMPDADGQNLLWYEDYPGTGFSAAPQVDVSDAGTHTFFVTQNDNGCESDTASLTIHVMTSPIFNIPDSAKVCEGSTLILAPPYQSDWTYGWSDGSTDSVRIISQAGLYQLDVSNQCGTNSDFCFITMDDCNCYFYVPNSFTPNSDSNNERFGPVFDCDFEVYQLYIFDRWGQLVFSTTDPNQTWNGTIDGVRRVPDDVYVWKVQFTDFHTSEIKEYTGHVTVLK